MNDTLNPTLVEKAMRILDLESEVAELKAKLAQLSASVNNNDEELSALKAAYTELKSEYERQRLDGLRLEREVLLANNKFDKASKELPSLRQKLSESEKARKALSSLNPERLKKQVVEQKKKVAEAQASVKEWQSKLKATREEHKKEVDGIYKSLHLILDEQDWFSHDDQYYLTLSRFAFPGEEKPPVRIRVTNRATSCSIVVKDVVDGKPVLSDESFPLTDGIISKIVNEWACIQSTGNVSEEAQAKYALRRDSQFVRGKDTQP